MSELPPFDPLPLIAIDEGVAPADLWVERGHVWRRTGDDGLRCICALGTPYWNERIAAAVAARAVERARRSAGTEPLAP